MLEVFSVACDPWGVQVERVEVKNLAVAKEMVVSMAVEAKVRNIFISIFFNHLFLSWQASREANGLMIMQQGEGLCLEKIK